MSIISGWFSNCCSFKDCCRWFSSATKEEKEPLTRTIPESEQAQTEKVQTVAKCIFCKVKIGQLEKYMRHFIVDPSGGHHIFHRKCFQEFLRQNSVAGTDTLPQCPFRFVDGSQCTHNMNTEAQVEKKFERKNITLTPFPDDGISV